MEQREQGREITFNKSTILISTTDVNGKITYANENFCDVSGFSLEELVGQNHNIVRHGDMPKAAFKDLWTYIQQGKSWAAP